MTVATALVPKTPEFFSDAIVLGAGCQILGRSSQCQIVVADSTISRRNAEIVPDAGELLVRDLDSLNGTYVNEERVGNRKLRIGDQLRFGRVAFLLALACGQTNVQGEEKSTEQCGASGKPCELHRTIEILSPAELRVLELLANGLAEKQIAAQLKISKHTVHSHVKSIYRELRVHSRPELLARFLRGK